MIMCKHSECLHDCIECVYYRYCILYCAMSVCVCVCERERERECDSRVGYTEQSDVGAKMLGSVCSFSHVT